MNAKLLAVLLLVALAFVVVADTATAGCRGGRRHGTQYRHAGRCAYISASDSWAAEPTAVGCTSGYCR